ncbi:MAG: hypothetical protein HZC54_00680 [Verrucomicrobia bacterium]|nr:hypothetical protein [Verrucomicrobiota bacterium]
MPAIVIQLLQIILPIIIKEGPAAVAAVKELFDKKEPTAEDWEKLRARSYESFGIPPAPPA